jgi:hypothetical protein
MSILDGPWVCPDLVKLQSVHCICGMIPIYPYSQLSTHKLKDDRIKSAKHNLFERSV